jgi:hypothetical protein
MSLNKSDLGSTTGRIKWLMFSSVAQKSHYKLVHLPEARTGLHFFWRKSQAVTGRRRSSSSGRKAEVCCQPHRFRVCRPPVYGRGSGSWDISRPSSVSRRQKLEIGLRYLVSIPYLNRHEFVPKDLRLCRSHIDSPGAGIRRTISGSVDGLRWKCIIDTFVTAHAGRPQHNREAL